MALIAGVVGVAVAAAAVKIIGLLNRTAEQIDELAKSADKLAIPIQELQKLRFAAELSGVGVDKLNTSLERMVKSISEAASGTGIAKEALKDLGLNARELNQLRPDQQFQAIADAMRNVAEHGDAVRFAMEIFGRSGAALVNTLNSDLRQTGEEFDSLGIAITRQQAAAVEAYNDAGTKLMAIWNALKVQITVAVVPAMQLIIDKVTQTIKEMGGIQVVARQVATVMIQAISGIVSAMGQLLGMLNKVIAGFKTLGKVGTAFKIVGKSLAGIAANVTGDTTASRIAKEDVKEDIKTLLRDPFAETTVDTSKIQSVLETLSRSISEQAVATEKQAEALSNGTAGGFGSITDVLTGRTLQTGTQTPQKVDVQIMADREGLVNAVVTSDRFGDTVQSQVDRATKDAARATRR